MSYQRGRGFGQNLSRRARNPLGFTIVEVLVAVTLLGLLLGLALPSYRAMVEKRQLTQGAEQIFAFLNSSQGVASRSNSVVTVSYARVANDDWCIGVVIGDDACDCAEDDPGAANFCSVDGADMRLTNNHVGNKGIWESLGAGDGAFAYDPVRGILVDPTDTLDATFHSPSGDYRLRLIVSQTGHAIMCSPEADHAVPGYRPCPAS